MANPCRNPDCGNTVSEAMTSGFCFTCQVTLAHQEKELEQDLEKVLRLESEFIAWCAAHDKPHPHT